MPVARKATPAVDPERFWKKVERGGEDECWEWTAGTFGVGYGKIRADSPNSRRCLLAHRVAWVLSNGRDVPSGLQVLHCCDNRLCCNPAHLFVGTHVDNMRDMVEKGRSPKTAGEANGFHRLTIEAVREIRKEYASGQTQQVLADRYGVTRQQISLIVLRRRWKHI